MKRMLGARFGWIQCLTRLKQHAHLKPYCTKTKFTSSNNGGGGSKNANGSANSSYEDAYRQLDKLDFMTAAKILFTSPPPKKKKFGLDFHLVQLFFTCLPSLAVYLVAQYARSEIKRMEEELQVKEAQEKEKEAAEAKAKELESNGDEEKVPEISIEIVKVTQRLDKLEETIKEIVSEPKKQVDIVSKDHQKDNNSTSAKRPQEKTEPSHSSSNENSINEKMKRSPEAGPVSSPIDQRDN